MSTIVDLYLYGVALDQGKHIEGLESLSDQQDERPGTIQDAREFLDGSAYEEKMLERVKSLYAEGDVQQLYELIHAADGGQLRTDRMRPADPMTGVFWDQEYTRGLEKKQLRAYLDQFIEPTPGL